MQQQWVVPDMTKEENDLVDDAIERNNLNGSKTEEVKNKAEILATNDSNVITWKSLQSLIPPTWLNDEMVNVIFILLWGRDG